MMAMYSGIANVWNAWNHITKEGMGKTKPHSYRFSVSLGKMVYYLKEDCDELKVQ